MILLGWAADIHDIVDHKIAPAQNETHNWGKVSFDVKSDLPTMMSEMASIIINMPPTVMARKLFSANPNSWI